MEINKQKPFIDGTKPPLNARGDGETDDAPAFQQAVDAAPAGTWPRLSETRSSLGETCPRGNDAAQQPPEHRS